MFIRSRVRSGISEVIKMFDSTPTKHWWEARPKVTKEPLCVLLRRIQRGRRGRWDTHRWHWDGGEAASPSTSSTPPTLTTPKRSPDQKLQINSENVTPSVFVPTLLDKNQFLEILIGGWRALSSQYRFLWTICAAVSYFTALHQKYFTRSKKNISSMSSTGPMEGGDEKWRWQFLFSSELVIHNKPPPGLQTLRKTRFGNELPIITADCRQGWRGLSYCQ